MASIHRSAGSKRWHVFFRFGGMQFKPSLKTTSQRDAENRRGEIERVLQHLESGVLTLPPTAGREEILRFILSGGKLTGKPKVVTPVTLQKAIDEYFEGYTGGKEPSSVATERTHTRHFLKVIGGETPLNGLTTDALQAYANARAKEPGLKGKTVSPRTIQKELVTFDQVWNMAVQKGYVAGPSPTKSVKLALTDEPLPFRTWAEVEDLVKRGKLSEQQQDHYWDALFLDEAQVLELVEFVRENAPHPFLHAAVAMAAFTGARRSEIMRSQIDDWDFERRTVRIRGRKDSRRQRTVFRPVPLHSYLQATMEQWFDEHPGGTHTIVVPPGLPRSRSEDGPTPMDRDQAHFYLQSTLARSKWKVLKGWHVLRHSFCSNCARRGIPDLTIDKWMGHRGDDAVKKRYRHLFPCDERLFMDRLFGETAKSA